MENIFNQENYFDFKNRINEIINDLNCFKSIDYGNDFKDLIMIENNDELFLEFIIFTQYQKWFIYDFDLNKNDKDLLFKELNKIKIYPDKNNFDNRLYKIIFNMHIYALIKIENIFSSFYKNSNDKLNLSEVKEINQSNHILIQILYLTLNLYKRKVFNLKKTLIFFDAIIIFINKTSILNDKYMRIKNFILLNLLFDKYFLNFLKVILNDKTASNRNDISLILNYLKILLQNKLINSDLNYSILVKDNIPTKIINILLNNSNYSLDIDFLNSYKINLIDCFTNIYKNKINNSNFFEILINHNKESFINLMNYQKEKESIFKDIYISDFYLELLYNLLTKENEINSTEKELMPIQSYFSFNGFNSEMVINLDSFSLDNSFLFFSFRLSPDTKTDSNTSFIFPLIIFEASDEKFIYFEILIKKEKNINKLFIIQDQKKQKNQKEIYLDKIKNIFPDVNYFFAIKFKDKKVFIYVSKNGKEKFYEEKEIYEIDKKNTNITMKLGNNNKNQIFKGNIGPLIIIKNLNLKRKVDKKDVVDNILELKNLYKFFPYFLSRDTIYNFDNLLFFPSIKQKKEFKNRITYLQNSIESFETKLYITPEIINLYYSNHKGEGNKLDLPKIPHINSNQNNNIFKNLNISTKIKSNIFSYFIRNNGLDYFCLIYEYLYQLFSIILKHKEGMNIFFNSESIINIIKDLINKTLIVLQNYTNYNFIVDYQKSFKTLFRNLFEVINISNKLSIKLFQKISRELYILVFNIKNKEFQLQNSINHETDNINLIDAEKIISNFSDGLFDMIYSPSLYEFVQDNNILIQLFEFSNDCFFIKKENKYHFKFGYFFKILNLVKILEKNESQKNITIISFIQLLNSFLNTINEQNPGCLFYKNLFKYIFNNYENSFIIMKIFLNFIFENIVKNFTFEKDEINDLLNYFNKINNEFNNKNIDNKIIEDINMIITKIISKISFNDNNSGEMILKICSEFETLKSHIIMSIIIINLKNIFDQILKSEQIEGNICSIFNINNQKDNIDYYLNMFENIFNFIFNLFQILVNNIEHKSEIIEEKLENDNFNKIVNLLINIQKSLESELEKNKTNIYYNCCLINFIIFYKRIIDTQSFFIKYEDKLLTQNMIKIIELIYNSDLITCTKKFELKYNNCELKKSIMEMIFELCLNFFLNDEFNTECYNNLLNQYNIIFYDRKFKDNVNTSIFFVNDNLRYYISKKNIKIDENIKIKCGNMKFYNNIFQKNDEFEGNFTTYFLKIIFQYQNIFEQKNFQNSPINKLNQFLDDLIYTILEEHKLLYSIDKKYFFKTFSSKNYNEQLLFIKDRYIKKKIKINEVKEYYKTKYEKYKNENNTNNKTNIQRNISKKNSNRVKEKKLSINEINDVIKIQIEFPKNNNEIEKIKYFYDLDKFYAINLKKEIMNCIFSVYYLDELFYSEDFCKIKKYYMNNFINNKQYQDSKQLNFPSILKSYSNSFEPSIFVKKYNNFITNPYFNITHSYIQKDKNLKSLLSMKKSIKLYRKEFQNMDNDFDGSGIECEIIKNEMAYYGKLIFNENDNYLLFREEKFDFINEQGFKHFLLKSYYLEKNKIQYETKYKKISIIKTYDKNILILIDDIEEIVEMRILLLWKGFEIYLKNGKSYIFNFLNSEEYESFMKNFITKSKINKTKGILRKRNFLTEKNNICKEWVNGLISNYEYLLMLNRYGSRSFNDPDQYPVFPWLLNDYNNLKTYYLKEKLYLKIIDEYQSFKNINEKENYKNKKFEINKLYLEELNENEKIQYKGKDKFNYKEYDEIIKKLELKIIKYLRNFRYPVSLQDEEKRTNAKDKYKDESKYLKFPSHSGCHYSTSGYVYFYLMRQQPYDNLLIKLQGYNLESVERCFSDISSTQKVYKIGVDNRELIPEFFTKIEFFLNLNCDYYGKHRISKNILDDLIMDILPEDNIENPKNNYLSKFITFILYHKKILNSDIIGLRLKKWIDMIFGVNQLPPENERLESCVVLPKLSYQQNINLEEKINKKLKAKKYTEEQIKEKLFIKVSYIFNFGIEPTKLFNVMHPELKRVIQDINTNKLNNKKINVDFIEENENEENDLESIINVGVKSQKLYRKIQGIPLFFQINSLLDKIIIYNTDDNLLIYDCQLYNEIYYKYFDIFTFNIIENSNIYNYGENSLYQIKYSFSSFDTENISISEEKDEYHTYYYNRIKYLINIEKIRNEFKNQKNQIIKLITCRHFDFSFKIYYIIKQKKKKEITKKIFSYICEDFVSSCCCISSNSFIIGLNNGKLIYYTIKTNSNNIHIKDNNIIFNEEINLVKERYIQAHKGKINLIEIDKRLGIIITAGDDNYIFIRKLYDFELLLPIKIKNKFIILMAKVISYNFLYILCLNKNNNKKIIFGYTLSGIKFAKSNYGLYNSISFNEDGNLVTLDGDNKIIILSGNTLEVINYSALNIDKEITEEIRKINPVNWIQYDYFLRKEEDEISRIITFFEKNEKDEYLIRANNLSILKNGK